MLAEQAAPKRAAFFMALIQISYLSRSENYQPSKI